MDYRLRIARRYLAGRREVSLISIITGISTVGVVLGVAALVVVLSVMNGFYDFVREMLVSLDPHVRIVSVEGNGLTHVDSVAAVAGSIPHVEQVAPYVEGKALLVPADQEGTGQVVVVRGVDPATSSVAEQITLGSFDLGRRAGRPGLVVGMALAQHFGLLPGHADRPPATVALLSAPALVRSFTQLFGAPPLQAFGVRGIYEMQATYEERHVFIGLEAAQHLFHTGSRVTGLELRLDNYQRADAVKAALLHRLPEGRYRVQTWYDLQGSLYDVMRLEKWGASAILLLIIVVAAFNIVGSLTMVVIEKRRDVGVLRAMGVSRRDIRRIFLLEGVLIGGIGTGAGLGLGLGLALLQKYYELVPLAGAESFLIDAYPVSIRFLDVSLIALVSMGLCVTAALYPAHRAAAIEPARAVHLEG